MAVRNLPCPCGRVVCELPQAARLGSPRDACGCLVHYGGAPPCRGARWTAPCGRRGVRWRSRPARRMPARAGCRAPSTLA
eukprot:6416909-Pyramimonas_sp.AAC.1